ncbi:hypothetical protein LMG24235_06914 [Paraburkholderia sabiae]|nr:hypothetical protein LMG24235_06914 [Paraburkholderia sabiae]
MVHTEVCCAAVLAGGCARARASVPIEGETDRSSQPFPGEQFGDDIVADSDECSVRSTRESIAATASEARNPSRTAAAWPRICQGSSISSITTFGAKLSVAAAVPVTTARVSSSESQVLVRIGIGPATGPATAAGKTGNCAIDPQAEPKRIGSAGGSASQCVNCCQTLRSNVRMRPESVSSGPARAREMPAQMTRTTANPRLEARQSAVKALRLIVDTGNPNTIDLSLKEFGLKIVINRTATRRRNIERNEPFCAALCQRVCVRNRSRWQKKSRIRLKSGYLRASGAGRARRSDAPNAFFVRSTRGETIRAVSRPDQ